MRENNSGGIRRQEPARVDLPEGKVRVLESHHAADFEMDTGAWPFHKVCWVAVGSGRLEHGSGFSKLRRDDFLLLPAGWSHRFVDDPGHPLTLVILCLSPAYLSQTPRAQAQHLWETALKRHPAGQPACARSAFHRGSLIERFRLALREQRDRKPGWETVLESVADRLLIRFIRGYCAARDRHIASSLQTVKGAIEYIDAHPYEALQIATMAERCSLSPRRFTDLFKQLTGDTFSHYLNRQRIRYACERLDETGHILYACHESGFNDVAYFYRVFKKNTGLTPGAYLDQPPGSTQSPGE
jgi:AraC-like DNA-binding protein